VSALFSLRSIHTKNQRRGENVLPKKSVQIEVKELKSALSTQFQLVKRMGKRNAS
jgi:hypothetical protein